MWRKEDVIEKLREDQGDRSLRKYATVIGCTAAYLSDIYNNRRDPGNKILKHLNLKKEVTEVIYTEKKKWRTE